MRIAIDLFMAFGFVCLICISLSPYRYPDTNRFCRALNFTPTNLCLRLICVVTGLSGLATISTDYGMSWPRDALTTVHFEAIASAAAISFLAVLAYSLFAKRVQGVR